jgi:glucosylceramidase
MYLRILPFILILASCTGKSILRIDSSDGKPWEKSSQALVILEDSSSPATVKVLLDQPGQFITGFGACFNELGWDALQMLDSIHQREVLSAFFDTIQGLKFNLCRMPMGANDYSRSWYSLDDSVGDLSLQYFSLAHDQTGLIPYIKKAMEYNPALRVWASPWCPPAWMKTNNHYACHPDTAVNDLPLSRAGAEGTTQFIMKPEYLTAYAQYFRKFIEGYRKEGIQLSAIHVQNEFNSCQNFPSCIWTATDLNTFIGKYLGPELRKNLPGTEIWLGTYERPWLEKIDTVLQDPGSADFISGVGFQWAGKEAIGAVHAKYPEVKLMETESECGNGSNDWKAAEYTWSLMLHYFNRGACAYMYWNMILDETGKSQWGWKQNSLVSVTRSTHKLQYNPEFYLMKHLSYFVKPGACFLPVEGEFKDILTFCNPDLSLVLICVNTSDSIVKQRIGLGTKSVSIELAAHSFSSVLIPAEKLK